MTAVNWAAYRKCPVCFAELGKPRMKLLGLALGGDARKEADRPHSGRKPRTGYGR